MGKKKLLFKMTASGGVSGRRFRARVKKAQYQLDGRIMDDMVPFMPARSGDFIRKTQSLSAGIRGTGRVYAAAPPYGSFLYGGKVMVDETTGSAWAEPGSEKVLTGKSLVYNKSVNADAQAHWFRAAKKRNLQSWLRIVKRTAGGGQK